MNIVRNYHELKYRLLYEYLSRKIVKRIQRAQSLSEISNELEIAEGLISRGDILICCFLGLTFFDQEKEWYDVEKAVHYFTIAADAGESNAQWHLGMIYYLGMSERGEDAVLGGYWMRKSAEQGNEYALKFLRMKEEGFSVAL